MDGEKKKEVERSPRSKDLQKKNKPMMGSHLCLLILCFFRQLRLLHDDRQR